jgi:hypothetical protein
MLINQVRNSFNLSNNIESILAGIDWKEWLYSGKLPPVIHESEFDGWTKMQQIFEQFKEGKTPENLDILKNSTGLKIAFTHKVMIEEGNILKSQNRSFQCR